HIPDRARHEGGDGRVRARHRARPRGDDRRRATGGGPHRSTGDRGLPGGPAVTPLLEVQDVHARYGAIEALKGVSLDVGEGEVVTLIGSNGAGKSTTLRSITG